MKPNKTTMIIAFGLVTAAQVTVAAAAPLPRRANSDGRDAAESFSSSQRWEIESETTAMSFTPSAEHIAVVAQQLGGDATVQAALRAVRVGMRGDGPASETRDEAPATTEQLLSALGFVTALDLQLLVGGPEAAELMDELAANWQGAQHRGSGQDPADPSRNKYNGIVKEF
eukprot:SAG31_NODE_16_length_36206_cov_27.355728_25_plen_171_part_00